MIAVLVPVLGRPANAAFVAGSLAAASIVPHRLVWICSPHDHEQIEACIRAGGDTVVADWEPGSGDFAQKINYAASLATEPWIFQAADDVTFLLGWDTALLRAAQGGAKVVGSNDLGNPIVRAGKHATHILFERGYIADPGASLDGPGTVFSERYDHQYVDTEAVELAKRRGVWAFAFDSHVRHEHPFWTGGPLDDTYRKGLAASRADAQLFRRRLRMMPRPGV